MITYSRFQFLITVLLLSFLGNYSTIYSNVKSSELNNEKNLTIPENTTFEKTLSFSIESQAFFRPYIGIWLGAAAVVPGTKLVKIVNTALGGGIFLRGYLERYHFAVDLSASYLYYTSSSDSIENLHSVPIYATFLGILPLPGPLRYFIKIGGGINWFLNNPEKHHNTLPMFVLGLEFHFPAGSLFNIGAKFEYLLAIENGVPAPQAIKNYQKINGHFFTFGLSLHFTWVR